MIVPSPIRTRRGNGWSYPQEGGEEEIHSTYKHTGAMVNSCSLDDAFGLPV